MNCVVLCAEECEFDGWLCLIDWWIVFVDEEWLFESKTCGERSVAKDGGFMTVNDGMTGVGFEVCCDVCGCAFKAQMFLNACEEIAVRHTNVISTAWTMNMIDAVRSVEVRGFVFMSEEFLKCSYAVSHDEFVCETYVPTNKIINFMFNVWRHIANIRKI